MIELKWLDGRFAFQSLITERTILDSQILEDGKAWIFYVPWKQKNEVELSPLSANVILLQHT